MSFDREALSRRIRDHGRIARVVIAAIDGSSPREPGAAMLVWAAGAEGTIGGGAMEWQAMARARALLAAPGARDPGRALAVRLERVPLGPTLGQCCGGAVTLVTEVWDAASFDALPGGPAIARPLGAAPMPLTLRRLLGKARAEGAEVPTRVLDGWIVEPAARPTQEIWIWGAGHVGRALVGVLAPLPGRAITWVDTAADRFPPDRFPAEAPEVTRLVAADPARLVAHAPAGAEHLILTYSHALDLELCHRLLSHGFQACGLIGSRTKWARFRARLRALGHAEAQIDRIACPIGDPALGKHPQAIAIGVAAALLRPAASAARERTA